MSFPKDLKDKNGTPVNAFDVIWDGKDYYQTFWDDVRLRVDAISCTKGYIHDISNETLKGFERIGTYKGHEYLFECD